MSFTHRFQIPYLVEFGFLVGKDIGATNFPLGVVVIHKHKSITTRKETPRLP